MNLDVAGLLGQWGIAGAVVFQTWMLFRYLEGKDDDKIASNTERITKLEAERASHTERLDRHSTHKVNRDTFSRELSRMEKRNKSLEKHLEKHGSKDETNT